LAAASDDLGEGTQATRIDPGEDGHRFVMGASQQSRRADVRFGSKADIAASPINVRFTPKSGHRNSAAKCPLCAKSGLMQCSKKDLFDHHTPFRHATFEARVVLGPISLQQPLPPFVRGFSEQSASSGLKRRLDFSRRTAPRFGWLLRS